ncbi:hypothetical protein OWM54_20520 [Myxococcus sp. MISCRS1]|jgi:hypothetical protein|uniref:hypothetical protein n=1 Tax=Myxococcus TaxID=32 RepID=UPI001CBAD6B6|nr:MULTISPECIES: hypothetical protein [Myxococcus]MBZ4413375.1 hypothetical protein [Myxococcus sp. XM-1-1-1]MCK8499686.1 hypothetical protein [Myxococcus fulvus]MCY0999522.1 hypothetical protein [Myxococcus sp. MISCRS1]BDT38679.1 hypothetical protein MFMH1_83480 [Myxococcus sp. MH1]
MAKDPRRQPATQPAEDFYGRPTGPRGEPAPREEREPPRVPPSTPDDDAPERHGRAHPIDPAERTPEAILDDIPDGDGPRSDAGTNPLPDLYWTAFPGSLEEEKD